MSFFHNCPNCGGHSTENDTDTGTHAKDDAMQDAIIAFLEDVWIFPNLIDDGSLQGALGRIVAKIDAEVDLNHRGSR